ncbi:MAG: hypothetical protein ACYC0Q_02945 [Eubacteriales bacterium]
MSESTLDSLLNVTSELASRKKTLAREILLLTSRQSGMTEPDRLEELLSTVEKKEGCIKSFDEIDGELARLEEKITEAAGVCPGEIEGPHKEKWKTIEKTGQEIKLILKETLAFDDNNRMKIEQVFSELKNNILSLGIKRGCYNSYQAPAVQYGGYFVDQKK